jgi:anti-sigma B factor antagonist
MKTDARLPKDLESFAFDMQLDDGIWDSLLPKTIRINVEDTLIKDQAACKNAIYTLIAISGEFDVVSEPQFTSAATTALAKGCTDFIVDLDGVTFLDGRALGALIDFSKSARERDGSARFVSSNAFHRRLFSITGIDRVLKRFDSRPQAEVSLIKQLLRTPSRYR